MGKWWEKIRKRFNDWNQERQDRKDIEVMRGFRHIPTRTLRSTTIAQRKNGHLNGMICSRAPDLHVGHSTTVLWLSLQIPEQRRMK